MTREESIEIIQKLIGRFKSDSRTYKALEMAIQALSQEPTSEKELNKAYTFGHNKGVKAYYNEQLCTVELPEAVFEYILSLVPTEETEQEPCDDAISREAAINIASLHCLTIDETVRAIKNLPSVTQKSGKWIPVSERLPEDAQEVLYSTKTGRVFHGEYYDDNTDRKWFSYKDDIFSFNNVVTAWMPLPKPYKPQESEDKE